MYVRGFASTNVHARETAKRADGRAGKLGEGQIKLDNLVTVALAGVLHVSINVERLARLYVFRGKFDLAVGKLRVAEAVTKGIERRAGEVAVCPVRHRIVLKRWKLVDASVKGDREAAGGIIDAGKSLRDGRAALFTGVPRFEYRVGVLFHPVHAEGAAVKQNHDQRLACRGDAFQQILLGLGQVEARAIAAFEAFLADQHFFALEFAGDADHGYYDIRVLGGSNGFWRWTRHPLDPH